MPVLAHALSDYSWVLMDPAQNTAIVSGNTDWKMIFIGTATYVFMARLILSGRSLFEARRFEFVGVKFNSLLRYLGLVE